jgi:hypothetical protein
VEPFFARVTYTDSSTAVVTASWTAPGVAAQTARLFDFAAPEVTSDTAQMIEVSFTEDGETVERMRRRSITMTPSRGGYVVPHSPRHADVLPSQPADGQLPDLQP